MLDCNFYGKLYNAAVREDAGGDYRRAGQLRNRGKLRKFWAEDFGPHLKDHKPEEISVRSLWESFVPDGREILDDWRRNPAGEAGCRGVSIAQLEATGATTTDAFSRITGQVAYNAALEMWEQSQYLADQLTTTVPTRFLDGEKIPGASTIGDATQEVGEGMPYPWAGPSQQWIETPATTKHGVKTGITKEMVIADNINIVLDRIRNISDAAAVRKEKRVMDMVVGTSTLYRRNGGSLEATYATTSGEANIVASNALQDWSDIEALEDAIEDLTDPFTGEPIVVNITQLLVPGGLKRTAQRVVNATEVAETTNTNTVTLSVNPLNLPVNGAVPSSIQIMWNQYVKARSNSATTWFAGNFARAFAYMEVWPISVVPMGPNSQAEFDADIVEQYKVSERGTPAVKERLYAFKCTA